VAWGSLHIPRHSFIVLSAILNRLTIKTGGLERDGALKKVLFFSCAAVREVWSKDKYFTGVLEIEILSRSVQRGICRGGFADIIARWTWCSYNYVIWWEGNRDP